MLLIIGIILGVIFSFFIGIGVGSMIVSKNLNNRCSGTIFIDKDELENLVYVELYKDISELSSLQFGIFSINFIELLTMSTGKSSVNE